MAKTIQVRNVPDEVHRKLKAKAAEEGLSLSEFLLRDARKLAERPTDSDMRRRLSELPKLVLKESPAETIRSLRGE